MTDFLESYYDKLSKRLDDKISKHIKGNRMNDMNSQLMSKLKKALYQVLGEKITPNVNEHLVDFEGKQYVLIFGEKSAVIREGGLIDSLIKGKK